MLSYGHEITIVRTEAEEMLDSDTHLFDTLILAWTQTKKIMTLIQNADAIIYQVGDNHEFHKGALAWLEKIPGIVILHDFFLGHLFWAWGTYHRSQANAILEAWYEEKAAHEFFNYPNTEDFIEGTRDTTPMTEWICSMATAVITHSSWGCERVLNSCPGPVHVIPLAYSKKTIITSCAIQKHKPSSEKFVILTIGHINPNKRAESVIRAIGKSTLLREHTVYHLVGAIEPEHKLKISTLANSCGVNVVISGEVDDQVLMSAIEESDVVSCLRWPSLEAASASLIEVLLHGKPAIVTDIGFYKEIPSSCALKINPENELLDLQLALEYLFNNSHEREAMSTRAQNWAAKTFTADNYAQELVGVIEEMLTAKPVLDAINYFYDTMHKWGDGYNLLNNKKLTNPLLIFENQ